MFIVSKKWLYIFNTMVWGIPGCIITWKGAMAYHSLDGGEWWMYLVSLSVLAAFILMFRKVAGKYCARIVSLDGERHSIFKAISIKGYLLIAFMIGLGMVLKFIPGMPATFFATFYCGLGPGLLYAAVKFLLAAK